jgi:predicted enzyme related to lactoylglutathione lyase
MGNPLGHFEFMTDDPEKTKAYYGKVFSWEFDDKTMPGYTLIRTGLKPGGGVIKRPESCPHPVLNCYFEVESIMATIDKAESAGGKVIVPKTEIPDTGWYAMIADPDGICVGLYEGKA